MKSPALAILLLCLLAAALVPAQAQSCRPSDSEFYPAAIQSLQAQRNAALDAQAAAEARETVLRSAMGELQAQIDHLIELVSVASAQIEKMEKQQAPKTE